MKNFAYLPPPFWNAEFGFRAVLGADDPSVVEQGSPAEAEEKSIFGPARHLVILALHTNMGNVTKHDEFSYIFLTKKGDCFCSCIHLARLGAELVWAAV